MKLEAPLEVKCDERNYCSFVSERLLRENTELLSTPGNKFHACIRNGRYTIECS
jgi:hypothetical protein